jgi:NAD(P)-dependent dehydrogenase (short-subunit alcohol dehydrogenase family)
MAEKKIVLITGGNAGIGFEAVKALLESDKQQYVVLMGTRSLEKGQKAIDELKKEVVNTSSAVELVQVDISSDESIEAAYAGVKAKYDHIDALINNAGESQLQIIGQH